jgi:hypothetical protein
MTSETYQTTKGVTQYRPVLTEAEASRLMFDGDGAGFCLACGEEASGCEPDARRYECESCGERKVYGIEELVVMGLVKIQ